jgi:hypothetical protein
MANAFAAIEGAQQQLDGASAAARAHRRTRAHT